MKTLTIESAGPRYLITFTPNGGKGSSGLYVEPQDALCTLVEAILYYDMITEGELAVNVGLTYQNDYSGLGYALTGKDSTHLQVSLRNGDTGDWHTADGTSFVRAVAQLLRDTGFKTQYPILTSQKFAEDFQYGFQRASDEQLALEMEAILTPEKGAW
jgi:hypothetical protein